MPSRPSLDSRASRPLRSTVNGNTFERPTSTEEEAFEEVGLNDEPKPKKKSFLSRFGETTPSDPQPAAADFTKPASSHYGFHLPGRKRGQSGVGAELGEIGRPTSKGKAEAAVR